MHFDFKFDGFSVEYDREGIIKLGNSYLQKMKKKNLKTREDYFNKNLMTKTLCELLKYHPYAISI